MMLATLQLLLALSLPAQDAEPTPDLDAVIAQVQQAGEDKLNPKEREEAVRAAATEALEAHAAALAQGDGGFYRGQLLASAGKPDDAYDVLVKFVEDNPGSAKASQARLWAVTLGMQSRTKESLLKLLDGIDAGELLEGQDHLVEVLGEQLREGLQRDRLHGAPMPHFDVLKALNGSFDPNQRGKVLVLDFWATWCPPCRELIPDLVRLQAEHPDDVQVVGVTRFYGHGMDFSDPDAGKPHGGKSVGRDTPLTEEQEVAVNEAFIKAFELNYPIVFTGRDVISGQYRVRNIPTVFVIGRDGNVLGHVVGGGEEAHARLLSLVQQGIAQTSGS